MRARAMGLASDAVLVAGSIYDRVAGATGLHMMQSRLDKQTPLVSVAACTFIENPT